ncbi:MAG: TolC family protein [Saprospiraceae bacterium]|nr:TolC family protein [Saprospiraceae bacterium]
MQYRLFLFLYIFYLSALTSDISGQTVYSLNQALKDAVDQAPTGLIAKIAQTELELKLKSLSSKNLPQLAFGAQATYQSATTGLDLSLPGFAIPRLSRDQYKMQLDASQMIYDGGSTSIQKNIAGLNYNLETAQVMLDMEQVKEQIINVFFGILESKLRLEIISHKKEDISASLSKIEVAVTNGVVLKSELKNLQAELLSLSQVETEIRYIKQNQISIMNLLTNLNHDEYTIFEAPELSESNVPNYTIRPMFRILMLQTNQIDQITKLDFAFSKPKLLLFAQGGYGKPGLNFLKNEFTEYYIGGLKLQWNLNKLYTSSKDKEISVLQKQKIESKRLAYTQQTEIRLTTLENDVNKYKEQFNIDFEILALRNEIKNIAKIKLEQGALTSSEFLSSVNDENEAMINKELHQLMRLKSTYLFQLMGGNL